MANKPRTVKAATPKTRTVSKKPAKSHGGFDLFALIILVVFFSVIYLFAKNNKANLHSRFEIGPIFYNVIGVDVSHYNQDIDWKKLETEGVKFAYIKATEGSSYIDPDFKSNWADVNKTKIRRGAYHFYTMCSSGKTQAQNFIKNVPKDDNALIPVIDAEIYNDCTKQADHNVADEIGIMSDMMEEYYGCRPIIYTTKDFINKYLINKHMREKYWIRSINMPPWFYDRGTVFWQYQDKGRRKGIDGNLDLDVFMGSEKEFDTYMKVAACKSHEN